MLLSAEKDDKLTIFRMPGIDAIPAGAKLC